MASPPSGQFSVGSRIAGYVLEEQIGQGGMAAVFRAHDDRLDRYVALKILAPALAADDEFRQRFIRESRAAAAVDDPHIVPVFEAGEASGVLFIAMRFVGGGDVASVVRRSGSLAPEEAAGIVSQVASALDAAHARGLVHRDVKPSNMLLDAGDDSGRPDHVYLSDFGLSKAHMSSAKITATGQFLGTLDYISPEQVNGDHVGPAADQYSLACAAFELLSGIPPFRRDTGMALMYAHLHQPPPTLSGVRPELSATVDAVFARALSKAPADRYASCREFAEAMRSALGLPSYRGAKGSGQGTAAKAPVRVPDAMTVTYADGMSADDHPITEMADLERADTQLAQARQSDTQLSDARQPDTQLAEARQPDSQQADTKRPGAEPPGTSKASVDHTEAPILDRAAPAPWWRSRTALVVGIAAVVLVGVSLPLLLHGSGPPGSVIFSSNLSSGSGDGWHVQPDASDGSISGGSYNVRSASSGATEIAVPAGASQVYPSAPADVRIDVTARATKGPAGQMHYGIACRDTNGNAYLFDIQGDKASIGKLVQGGYQPLHTVSSGSVQVGGANQLTATCKTVAGQASVRLSFAVNGTQLITVTDRASPLSGGSVGFFTGFYNTSIPGGVAANFHSFVVRQA